jgi:hypothetical protein
MVRTSNACSAGNLQGFYIVNATPSSSRIAKLNSSQPSDFVDEHSLKLSRHAVLDYVADVLLIAL